ncbi:MAG: hypothetical protein AAFV29_01135 [Myxococcota bacterium]
MRIWSALWVLVAGCGGESFTELISEPNATSQIVVRWTIEADDGQPLTCAEAQVEAVRISVGGEPVRVACSDQNQAVFDELQVGRYPIVIRLLGAADAVVREHVDSVELTEAPLDYSHTFVLDPAGDARGALDLRWLLAGEDPSQGCAVFGADRVVIQSQPGSIAELGAEVSCELGRFELVDVLRGDYTLRFTLLDNRRAPIVGGIVQRNFRVVPGETTRDLFSFPLVPAEQATLQLNWTLNGEDPALVCETVGGQQLTMELFQQQSPTEEISIRTATAACDRGALTEEDINASADPEALRFRVSVDLRGFAGLILTSRTVSDVILRRGETSTVSFDLMVE